MLTDYRADLDDMLANLASRPARADQECISAYLLSFARQMREALWTHAAARAEGYALAREAETAAYAALGWGHP